MNKSELAQINERIAGVERVLFYLNKKRIQLFDSRGIQSKEYKLTIDEIAAARLQINELKAMRNA